MHSRVDDRLRAEASRFAFRFACPDCAYFDETHGLCSEGYPLGLHVRRDLERSEVVFCKLFEGA